MASSARSLAATVSEDEARTHFSAILAAVETGTEFEITRAGTPIARILPPGRHRKRELGFVPLHIPDSFDQHLRDDDLAAWDGDAE